MIYIAYATLILTVLQFLVSIINLLTRPRFKNKETNYNGLISVLIPARNEEKNIINLLVDLQKQQYNNIEILVYDDQSTDKTAEIVKEMSLFDNKIKLLTNNNLPLGWLGKNYACYKLAQLAKGEYFLFLDADVRLDESLIGTTINYIQKSNSKLLTIFPKQITNTLGEKAVVPIMNYILLSLLPLFLVEKSRFSSLAAANGQFMMFEANTYKNIEPHKQMKMEKVEDIKIARLLKTLNKKLSCVLANDDLSCRMYSNYKESINGFSKNLVMFFGNSIILTFLFWLISSFGFVFIFLKLPGIYFAASILMVVLTRVFISIASKQNILTNILLHIPQQINFGIILYTSIVNNIKGNYEWKGRKIK